MKALKILRKLLENEEAATTQINMAESEKKWFEIGFNTAKSRFEGLISLLEEADQ